MITTVLYSCVFHGAPGQVARVRADMRDYLDGCLMPDDTTDSAVLITSELAANAILHSASRGAFVIVRAETFPGYVWVECEDLGGPWHPRQRDGRPHGLSIVEALTGPDGWGVETTIEGGRVVWARISKEAP